MSFEIAHPFEMTEPFEMRAWITPLYQLVWGLVPQTAQLYGPR